MIAEVIIDSRAKKLNRKFDYKIPDNLRDLIDVGSRVLVPFANFKNIISISIIYFFKFKFIH